MEKVVVYFSDIMGTVVGKNENTKEDYQKFNTLLSRIKECEQADKVIFSLISSDNQEIVSNVQDSIRPFIDQTVTFGKQFFGNGYYTESEVVQKNSLAKAADITQYIQELSQNYEITSVYYADDVSMYHEMLSFFAEDNGWDQQLQSIIPTENIGVAEVNQLLEKNLKERFGIQK